MVEVHYVFEETSAAEYLVTVTVHCRSVFSVIWIISAISAQYQYPMQPQRKLKGGPLLLEVLHEKSFNIKARVCCRIHHIHPPFGKDGGGGSNYKADDDSTVYCLCCAAI